jgi:hypothetical protein
MAIFPKKIVYFPFWGEGSNDQSSLPEALAFICLFKGVHLPPFSSNSIYVHQQLDFADRLSALSTKSK